MKCRMMFLAVLATTCLSLGWSSTVTAAPIILDDFSKFPGTWTNVQGPGTLQSNTTRTLILGGAGLNNVGDGIQINTGTQQFIVAHSPQSDFDLTLSYNTPGNFSSSNAVILQFETLDIEMVITMTVNTMSGNLTANYTVPPQTTPFTFTLPFSSLAGSGNLANTTGISLKFNSDNRKNIDFILRGDAGGIILNGDLPEPGTLATLGLIGVVGGLALRRRLRKGEVA